MSSSNNGFPGNSGFPGSPGSPNGAGGNPGGQPGGFPGVHTTHNTEVKIIHDDGSWSNTIRSLFIYGTGALRLKANFTRGGTPVQRVFIIGSTLAADNLSRLLKNVINDQNYVKNHVDSWKTSWNADGTANVQIDSKTEQAIRMANSNALGQSYLMGGVPGSDSSSGADTISEQAIRMANSRGNGFHSGGTPGSASSSGIDTSGINETAKSMIGGDIEILKIYEAIYSRMLGYLHNLFEPVPVTFSNELLSEQINFISILLFMLTVIILIFFISLLFNITLFIFSDKLLNYLKNKYILWYLSFNKKVLGFEIIMLSGWIFYLLYMVLFGLHYIATHPILL